jgi:hypothetical protein
MYDRAANGEVIVKPPKPKQEGDTEEEAAPEEAPPTEETPPGQSASDKGTSGETAPAQEPKP